MTTLKTTPGRRVGPWVVPAVLLLVGGLMAAWTWGSWLDPVVDFGRELYVPWRITEGEVLYRDLAWFNGPLSPHVNALLFLGFGVGLRTLVVFNLLVIAGVCFLLYRLLAGLSDRLTATVACALFLFVFCFGRLDGVANFNWVCPYSHEMTHGIGLSILVVWALTRWARNTDRRLLFLGGVGTGLVFLTKPEVFLGCALAVGAALLLAWMNGSGTRARAGRDALLFGAGAAVPIVGAFALLATALPLDAAASGTLGGWWHVFSPELSSLRFYRSCMGTDAPGRRLLWVAAAAVVWLGILGPGLLAALRLREDGKHRVALALAVAAVTLLLWGVAAVLFFTSSGEPPWRYAYLPLPVALSWIAVSRLRAWRAAGPGTTARRRAAEALALGALAAGLLVKILLNARVSNYGFGLAAPAGMLGVVALLHWLPEWVAERGGSGPGFRITGLGVLGLIVLGHGATYVYWDWADPRSHSLGSGPDVFATDDRGKILGDVLARMSATDSDTTFLVLPEGVMLNYLARRRNPAPYFNFLPPELIMFGEDEILASLAERPADFVVLVSRPTREYGLPLFGMHYGRSLLEWVRRHYTKEVQAHGPEPLHPDRLKDGEWAVWVLGRAE